MAPQSKNSATDTFAPGAPDECEMYRQGSEACRNYSGLTMRVRTLSQQLLVIAVAGLATALANENIKPGEILHTQIFIAAGIALVGLSFSLLVVDWHYQSAFTAIRNSLAFMESRNYPFYGPWVAHFNTRTQFRDHIASYLPFHLLAIIGGMGIWHGLSGNLDLLVMIVAGVSTVFIVPWWRAWSSHTAITQQLNETLGSHGFCLDRKLGLVPSKDAGAIDR